MIKQRSMARIEPVQQKNISPAIKIALERQSLAYKECVNNMQSTLGHSLVAFDAYMQWYPLYEKVEEILGSRLAYLYGFALSREASCTLCTTYFRKQIKDAGDDPDHLILSPDEKSMMEFGAAISKHHGNIVNHLFNNIARNYSQADLVTLVAFAGQMIAVNIFNNVIEIEPDDYLKNYLPVAVSMWA